jgi:hypothetical protein
LKQNVSEFANMVCFYWTEKDGDKMEQYMVKKAEMDAWI